MRTKHTLLFCISIWVASFTMLSQTNEVKVDTLNVPTKYGLRLGVDLSKPLRTLLDNSYSGLEIVGDYRISKKFYVAAELGTESKDFSESNLKSKSSGSYIKLGVDYNSYVNWIGMHNEIFTGLRFGYANFKDELLVYQIYNSDQTFTSPIVRDPQEFSGLSAQWAEFVLGIKTEVFNNLYLSVNLRLKRLFSDTKPENFDNLFIPGYQKTNDFSKYGAGYGYTISYLIPLYKK